MSIFGHDNAPFMSMPGRNCDTSDLDSPQEIQEAADMWHPTAILERQAKRLCHGCPAILECRLFAMERPELEGIWGGTTTAERILMRAESVA